VVDHVQGGQVGELLPQHEEEGVEEVHKLGDEVPPGHVQRGQARVASNRQGTYNIFINWYCTLAMYT
jgi:hypothetical protein